MKGLIAAIAACACLVAGCGGSDGLGAKPEIPQGPSKQKLIVKDLDDGDGDTVKAGEVVDVHYVAGIYETGKEIESAWVDGEPLALRLSPGEVLPGWEKGLPGMQVGGRRELIFPATRSHAPPGSEPGDTLVYLVDVVAVEE